MTKPSGIYPCDICGKIVTVVGAPGGTPVCCGQPKVLMQEKTAIRVRRISERPPKGSSPEPAPFR